MDFKSTDEKLEKLQKTMEFEVKVKESLSKLQMVENRLTEVVPVTIKSSESLSAGSKFSLPLKVKGRMLGVGRHSLKYYTAEQLKKSVDKHGKKKIPIKLDHRDKEAGSTIGVVDFLVWDDAEQAIVYEGHINDETHARNVLDGIIKDVSATIFSIPQMDESLGLIGVDPEYTELSIVEGGAYKNNSIAPVM